MYMYIQHTVNECQTVHVLRAIYDALVDDVIIYLTYSCTLSGVTATFEPSLIRSLNTGSDVLPVNFCPAMGA